MKTKNPGKPPAGYYWMDSNCHTFDTWEEEIEHAKQKGFELVGAEESLSPRQLYFTLRKAGFDTFTGSSSRCPGELGYPIYRRSIDGRTKQALKSARYPVLAWPRTAECLRADVGITPQCQHVYRTLWWNDSANAYVGDGKWIVGNEPKDYQSVVWDEQLATDTNHVLTISTTTFDRDSVKDLRDQQMAGHLVILHDLLKCPLPRWHLHGVWGAKLAGVQNVAIEGRSYKLFKTSWTGGYGTTSEEWDVTDTSPTPQEVQDKLVNALRFYTSKDHETTASIALAELGFSPNV